jgi:hypothetical protein
MGDQRRQRLGAPRRPLIGPLVMLVSGALAGAALLHFLMLEPGPVGSIHLGVPESLSAADHQALDHLLRGGGTP